MYHPGIFLRGDSLLHQLDPRIKLGGTAVLSIIILASQPLLTLLLGIILLLAAVACGIWPRFVWQAVRPFQFFIALIFLVHVFLVKPPEAGGLFSLTVVFSIEGLQQALAVTMQFVCLIMAAVILTMTTLPSALVAAIKYFLRPLKYLRVPVDDIAVMLTLALRLTPLLLTENKRRETAQKARCYDLIGRSWRVKAYAFLSLLITLLLNVFRRADKIAQAMEARLYTRGSRTSAVELKFRKRDFIALALFIVFIVIFMAINSSLR